MKKIICRPVPDQHEAVQFMDASDAYELSTYCGGYITVNDLVMVPVLNEYDGDRVEFGGKPADLTDYVVKNLTTGRFSVLSEEEYDTTFEVWPDEPQDIRPGHLNPDTGQYNPNEA